VRCSLSLARMGRGLQRLLVVDPGFTFDRVALLDPSLARHGISGDAARAYWSQVVQKIASHPDVVQTSLAFPAPLGGAVNTSRYGADSGALSITVMRVEPAFFPLLEIPLLAGRNFEPGDDSSLVIISRRLAMTMYGTLDVLGKGYPRTKPTRTIVGIAADAMVAELCASNAAEEYMPLSTSQYESKVRSSSRRVLGGAPFHLAVADPIAPAAALVIFALAGLIAALVPAWRAMRADPMHALRHE
jgi:hypothetical protein